MALKQAGTVSGYDDSFQAKENVLMGWLRKLADWLDPLKTPAKTQTHYPGAKSPSRAAVPTDLSKAMDETTARVDAKNRLKLVLMHDRTQLSPALLEKMRDDMVEVISRYVEIDREALEVNLENETNTIALVASIPVLRARVV
jgi:cell division topological specificity factor